MEISPPTPDPQCGSMLVPASRGMNTDWLPAAEAGVPSGRDSRDHLERVPVPRHVCRLQHWPVLLAHRHSLGGRVRDEHRLSGAPRIGNVVAEDGRGEDASQNRQGYECKRSTHDLHLPLLVVIRSSDPTTAWASPQEIRSHTYRLIEAASVVEIRPSGLLEGRARCGVKRRRPYHGVNALFPSRRRVRSDRKMRRIAPHGVRGRTAGKEGVVLAPGPALGPVCLVPNGPAWTRTRDQPIMSRLL